VATKGRSSRPRTRGNVSEKDAGNGNRPHSAVAEAKSRQPAIWMPSRWRRVPLRVPPAPMTTHRITLRTSASVAQPNENEKTRIRGHGADAANASSYGPPQLGHDLSQADGMPGLLAAIKIVSATATSRAMTSGRRSISRARAPQACPGTGPQHHQVARGCTESRYDAAARAVPPRTLPAPALPGVCTPPAP